MLNVSHSDVCMIIAKSSARNVLLLSTFDAAIYITRLFDCAWDTNIWKYRNNDYTINNAMFRRCKENNHQISRSLNCNEGIEGTSNRWTLLHVTWNNTIGFAGVSLVWVNPSATTLWCAVGWRNGAHLRKEKYSDAILSLVRWDITKKSTIWLSYSFASIKRQRRVIFTHCKSARIKFMSVAVMYDRVEVKMP